MFKHLAALPKRAFSVFANPHHRPGRVFSTNPLAAPFPAKVSRFSHPSPNQDPHLQAVSRHILPAQAPHPQSSSSGPIASPRRVFGALPVSSDIRLHQDQGSEVIPGGVVQKTLFCTPHQAETDINLFVPPNVCGTSSVRGTAPGLIDRDHRGPSPKNSRANRQGQEGSRVVVSGPQSRRVRDFHSSGLWRPSRRNGWVR